MNLKSVAKITRENPILVRKSVAKFYRENRILVIILLIAIFIILKFSTIEYIIGTPKIIQSIFDSPHEGSSLYEILRILENLSLAYIITFIFYILNEYIPNEKTVKKSYKIVESNVIELNTYIGYLVDSIKLLLEKENIDFKSIKDKYSLMDSILIDNSIIYFKRCDVDKCSVKFEEYEWNYINFKKELPGEITSITRKIEQLINIPAFRECSYELINTISELKSNKFLCKLRQSVNNIPSQGRVGVYGLGKEFISFLKIHEKLNTFTKCKDKKISKLMNEAEKEEYIKWLRVLKAKNRNFNNIKGYCMFQNRRIS